MKKIALIASVLLLGTLISCLDTSLPEPISFDEQLAADLEIIDAYLEENGIVTEADESGIRFLLIEEGSGGSPTLNDDVNVIYEARLLDGTVVDSSAEGVIFPLNQLILAWQIMIPKMNEGGKITLYAPSVYSYGSRGQGPIPPNANIIFDIELVEIVDD